MLVAYLLALASFAALLLYIHHIGQSMRVAGLIDLVGDDLRDELDNRYGEPLADEAGGPAPGVIPARQPGVVCEVDRERLVELAATADCRLELVPMMGDFVPAGAPLFRVDGDRGAVDDQRVRSGVILRLEPTLDQDAAYGIRMLVDIAERSLSESPFQDPTTAVQAIDRLHDCLRQLARRPFPDGIHRDADGARRLLVRTMDWEDYVHLAFDEVRMVGAGSPQVVRRLVAVLQDLERLAPEDRRPPLVEQLRLLEDGVATGIENAADVRRALVPDNEGIGAAAGSQRRR
jgi:uncharacterized membrane protein